MSAALKAAAKYGSKFVSFLSSAKSVIAKYGSAGWTWVKNNISYIADGFSVVDSLSDFKDWLSDELNSAFN